MTMIRAALALACLCPFNPAQAQIDSPQAIKAQADAMRAALKQSPVKPVGMTLGLYGKVLTFDMLRNFVPVFKAQNERQFLFEFAPDGETSERWSRLVTVTSVKGGGAARLDNAALAARLFRNEAGCAAGFFYKVLETRDLGSGLSMAMISKGCGKVAANAYPGAVGNSGEQNLVLHYRDAQNVYSVQYAIRGKGFAPATPPIPDAAARAQLAKFGTVRLCAPNATDAACRTALMLDKRSKTGQ
ncbi:hypothetical protein [Sphingobium boeckii]|uniref:Uncharacterized protein n=1 Tax=Sphingobium boeckii TaxID=1082345 RepID=A0A7W9EEN9_9SPHN|nr:hypothetical protein [Sphingobium boeckii]MBB5685205.1 hypothetical protein [Sphingobium boeckii]